RPWGRRPGRVGPAPPAPPPTPAATRLGGTYSVREPSRLGRAARIDAGSLHAIEDAVELVAAIFVRGPDGIERVELGKIAEAAVGGLGHGPLPGPMAPESLSGLDPEALRRLVVEVAGGAAGWGRGGGEKRGGGGRAPGGGGGKKGRG